MEISMTFVVVEGSLLVLGKELLIILDGLLDVILLKIEVGQTFEDVLRLDEVLLGLYVQGFLILLDSLVVLLQTCVAQTGIVILGVGCLQAVTGVEELVNKLDSSFIVFLFNVEHHTQTVEGGVAWTELLSLGNSFQTVIILTREETYGSELDKVTLVHLLNGNF